MTAASLMGFMGAEGFGALLVIVRVSAAFVLLPGFGETYLPPRVKLAAAILVALAIAPVVPGVARATAPDAMTGATMVAAEATAGLFLGTLARCLLLATHVAGSIVAQQIGLGQLTPGGVDPGGSPAAGNLLMLAAVNLLFAFKGHHHILTSLKDSYDLLPLGRFPDPGLMAERVTETVSAAFALGVRLSLPFLLSGFLAYVGLGVINRAMLQLPVYFVASPALTIAGLVLLAVALPAMLTAWYEGFLASGLFGG